MKHDDHICEEVEIAFGPGGNDQTWKGAAGDRYHLSQFVHQLQRSFGSWRDKGQPVCCYNVSDCSPANREARGIVFVASFSRNIGDDTSLARQQYNGAIGIVLVVTLVVGILPCVLRLPVVLLILAG